jgi:hypothetical protein
MIDWLEIQFWKVAKWIIRNGYGANCETLDVDDFNGTGDFARCASCHAREIIEWIDEHIELLK